MGLLTKAERGKMHGIQSDTIWTNKAMEKIIWTKRIHWTKVKSGLKTTGRKSLGQKFVREQNNMWTYRIWIKTYLTKLATPRT